MADDTRHSSRSSTSATSGSWPTSTRARRRRPSGSSTTPAAPTRWARSTRAPPSMDWMAQEQERGITITSAATTASWRDFRINIIDTPGHVDFTVEVERSLRVLDGAIAVFDSVAGVEPQSETVWRQADRYSVPRIAFINKMDRTGADFFAPCSRWSTASARGPVPVQLPIGQEEHFRGVDRPRRDARASSGRTTSARRWTIGEIPAELLEQAQEYHHQLIDAVADHDDELMETYLVDEDAVTPEMLKRALRAATLDITVTPVLAGSAFKNKGVQPLLDAVVDYLPSPLDVPPIHGIDPRTEHELSRRAGARRAVLGARLQGHVRPVRRQADVLPRLLGPAQGRRPRAEHDAPARPSASAASCRCTRTTARSARRSARARSPPSSASRTRRPATRSRSTRRRSCSSRWTSRSR